MDLQSVDLTANVGHAIYFNGTLAVAPEALGYFWRLDWWLWESHGHSVSPLNPLIVSIAMVNKAMFSLK